MLTLRTAVNQWESDQNNHWNVRFYGRSFQAATEVFLSRSPGGNPGARWVQDRHMRFHREVFSGSPVTVTSGVGTDGDLEGRIVHVMRQGDTVLATAIDEGCDPAAGAPWSEPELTDKVSPRGLMAGPLDPVMPDHGAVRRLCCATGVARVAEMDHHGLMPLDNFVPRSSAAMHNLMNAIGFTREFIARTRISRMAVEMKLTRHADCTAGTPLTSHTWISEVEGKSFSVRHLVVEARNGNPVMSIEHKLLFVDLNLRRSVPPPETLRSGLERYFAAEGKGQP